MAIPTPKTQPPGHVQPHITPGNYNRRHPNREKSMVSTPLLVRFKMTLKNTSVSSYNLSCVFRGTSSSLAKRIRHVIMVPKHKQKTNKQKNHLLTDCWISHHVGACLKRKYNNFSAFSKLFLSWHRTESTKSLWIAQYKENGSKHPMKTQSGGEQGKARWRGRWKP